MSSLKRKGIICIILAVIFIAAGAIFRACNLPSIFWIASFIIGVVLGIMFYQIFLRIAGLDLMKVTAGYKIIYKNEEAFLEYRVMLCKFRIPLTAVDVKQANEFIVRIEKANKERNKKELEKLFVDLSKHYGVAQVIS